jgi:hypothetical protein
MENEPVTADLTVQWKMRLGARDPIVPAECFTHSFMNLTVAGRIGALHPSAPVIMTQLPHAGFLLGLFFDPDDWGRYVLRSVCWLSRTTFRYIPEDRTLRTIAARVPVLVRFFFYLHES